MKMIKQILAPNAKGKVKSKVTAPKAKSKAKSKAKVKPFDNVYADMCTHTGVVEVAKLGESRIFAGAHRDVIARYTDFDLFIALNNKKVENPVRFYGDTKAIMSDYPILNNLLNGKSQIIIDWPDFGGPPLPADFLRAFVRQIQQGPARNVVIYCEGGHGRTGTFLALLFDLLGQSDPITHVRSHYCKKTVETDSQIRFLRGAGLPTEGIKPSYAVHKYTKHGGMDFPYKYDAEVEGDIPDKYSKGPACTHSSCPWNHCTKGKGGTPEHKLTRAERKALNEIYSKQSEAEDQDGDAKFETEDDEGNTIKVQDGDTLIDDAIHCMPPFKCSYCDGVCIHCGKLEEIND